MRCRDAFGWPSMAERAIKVVVLKSRKSCVCRGKLSVHWGMLLSKNNNKVALQIRHETILLIGCKVRRTISWPIEGFDTNRIRKSIHNLPHHPRPRMLFDLQGNNFMKHLTSKSTKLNVLGVKLQVNEVEKLDFHIHSKRYDWKVYVRFQQKCNQQLFPPHVLPSPGALPCRNQP